jgi:hypothetical protein
MVVDDGQYQMHVNSNGASDSAKLPSAGIRPPMFTFNFMSMQMKKCDQISVISKVSSLYRE